MKRAFAVMMGLVMVAVGCGSTSSTPEEEAPPRTDALRSKLRVAEAPVPGRYIVVLEDDVATLVSETSRAGVPSVAQAAQDIASQHGARLVHAFTDALRGFVVNADDQALARLLLDGRVAYVEEDGVIIANAVQSYTAPWGIDRVDQRSLPLNSSYSYGTTASNVNVYILDSGVLGTHDEFAGRMIPGYTTISDGRGTTDCSGHGTHIAGTVGGTTYGVAKGVKISPVRILDCTLKGSTVSAIQGIDWVIANHVKPAVANMSFSQYLVSSQTAALDDAVTRLSNAGVIVVVSAGNASSDACNYSPARVPAALTVGSTTSSDAVHSISNEGSCLDLFAPGFTVRSAWYTSTTASDTMTGTSVASAHVAGAAALYLAGNPTATAAQVHDAIVSSSTVGVLSNRRYLSSPNRMVFTGGFVSGPQPETVAPSAPSSLTVSGLTSSQVNLSWTASTDTGGSGLGGYRIERCAGVGCTSFAEIGWSTAASFASTGLTGGTSYSYRVRAFDKVGNNSGYSNTVTAKPPVDTIAPSASTLKATALTMQDVQLDWTASTDNIGGSGVAGYKIERCEGSSCTNFVLVHTVPVSPLWVIRTIPTMGKTYSYRIRAYDLANNHGAYSNTAIVQMPK